MGNTKRRCAIIAVLHSPVSAAFGCTSCANILSALGSNALSPGAKRHSRPARISGNTRSWCTCPFMTGSTVALNALMWQRPAESLGPIFRTSIHRQRGLRVRTAANAFETVLACSGMCFRRTAHLNSISARNAVRHTRANLPCGSMSCIIRGDGAGIDAQQKAAAKGLSGCTNSKSTRKGFIPSQRIGLHALSAANCAKTYTP